MLLQQQDGSGAQCVKLMPDLVSLSSQAQLLSVHSPLELKIPKVPVYGCTSHSPCGHRLGLGLLGAQAGWFVAAGLGSSSKAIGRLVLS